MLMFATVSGILMALFLNTAGGAWDNAKKLETLPAGDPPNAIGALPVRFKVNTDEEYKLHVARRNVETRMEKERKLREALRASSSGAFYTLVPIRPRSRGERRFLRTFAVISLAERFNR